MAVGRLVGSIDNLVIYLEDGQKRMKFQWEPIDLIGPWLEKTLPNGEKTPWLKAMGVNLLITNHLLHPGMILQVPPNPIKV